MVIPIGRRITRPERKAFLRDESMVVFSSSKGLIAREGERKANLASVIRMMSFLAQKDLIVAF